MIKKAASQLMGYVLLSIYPSGEHENTVLNSNTVFHLDRTIIVFGHCVFFKERKRTLLSCNVIAYEIIVRKLT